MRTTPIWATFFRELGFRVVLSPLSDRRIYELGMESIPSESECYPAKLAHGHVQWLVNQGIRTIFHPCVFYEHQETPGAQNHFNCPIVVSYPENIRKQRRGRRGRGRALSSRPFLAFTQRENRRRRGSAGFCRDDVADSRARDARRGDGRVGRAAARQGRHPRRGRAPARTDASRSGGRGVVLAGRPYHVDPEINHGIPELIASYGLTVLYRGQPAHRLHARAPAARRSDQWVYHSRLYSGGGVCPRGGGIWSSFSSTPSAAGSTPSRPTRSPRLLEGSGQALYRC